MRSHSANQFTFQERVLTYLYQKTQDLPLTGWIISIYGLVWGAGQLLTGHWSDKYGRKQLNVTGMVITTVGVLIMHLNETVLWWSCSAALTGLGMALLYPNLAAAIADYSQPQWRATAIEVYRFWRDLGYAIGALLLGLAAYWAQDLSAAFWVVGGCMAISSTWLAAKS